MADLNDSNFACSNVDCSLNVLPLEILNIVVYHLNPLPSDLQLISLVNRAFYLVCNDFSLWLRLYFQRLPTWTCLHGSPSIITSINHMKTFISNIQIKYQDAIDKSQNDQISTINQHGSHSPYRPSQNNINQLNDIQMDHIVQSNSALKPTSSSSSSLFSAFRNAFFSTHNRPQHSYKQSTHLGFYDKDDEIGLSLSYLRTQLKEANIDILKFVRFCYLKQYELNSQEYQNEMMNEYTLLTRGEEQTRSLNSASKKSIFDFFSRASLSSSKGSTPSHCLVFGPGTGEVQKWIYEMISTSHRDVRLLPGTLGIGAAMALPIRNSTVNLSTVHSKQSFHQKLKNEPIWRNLFLNSSVWLFVLSYKQPIAESSILIKNCIEAFKIENQAKQQEEEELAADTTNTSTPTTSSSTILSPSTLQSTNSSSTEQSSSSSSSSSVPLPANSSLISNIPIVILSFDEDQSCQDIYDQLDLTSVLCESQKLLIKKIDHKFRLAQFYQVLVWIQQNQVYY